MKPKDAERFYSLHARFYDLTRRFFLFRRRKAIDLLDPLPGETVVDFACGTGMNFPLLISRNPGRIVGIDYSMEMLRRARSKFPALALFRADATSYPFREKADKALCTYALSLIDGWEDVVLNIRSSLPPPGRLVVLDFHPLRGLLGPLNPLLRCWLSMWGVSAEKPIEALLRKHFDDVTVDLRPWGYAAIWIASGPRTSL
jgi:S-adenosylmethionine-diacylgycerolhomoserine-N-methlytransferase